MKIIKSDIKIQTTIYMYVHVLKTNDAISDINQIITLRKIVTINLYTGEKRAHGQCL